MSIENINIISIWKPFGVYKHIQFVADIEFDQLNNMNTLCYVQFVADNEFDQLNNNMNTLWYVQFVADAKFNYPNLHNVLQFQTCQHCITVSLTLQIKGCL